MRRQHPLLEIPTAVIRYLGYKAKTHVLVPPDLRPAANLHSTPAFCPIRTAYDGSPTGEG